MVNQSTAVALTAALTGMVAATPMKAKTGSFTLNQVANPSFKPHGPLQLAKAYNKYGIKIPEGLAQTVAKYRASRKAKRDSGSAANAPEQFDVEYLTPVEIGTPPQTMHLDIDSGSADLWVFSTETDSSSVNGQALYDPTRSSTAKQVDGAIWSILYGDGSFSSGDVYHDAVTLGGLTAGSQAVEVASTVSSQFTEDSNTDGVLGLAFQILNQVIPTREKTFFENIVGSLDAPVWTADLKHNAPGSYDFGVIDSSKYTGEIVYESVSSIGGLWDFTSKIYGVSINAIADTGTTLLLLPDIIVNKYYSTVSGAVVDDSQGGYVFPCDANLPDLVVSPGNTNITIPGEYMNWAPIDDTGVTCFGGIQSNGGVGLSIYGDVAFKAAFVVFDVSKGEDSARIGWASKAL